MFFKKISLLTRNIQRHRLNIRKTYHTKYDVYGHKAVVSSPSVTEDKEVLKNQEDNANLFRLVQAYREHGHFKANVDPLCIKVPSNPVELEPSRYGLNNPNDIFNIKGIVNMNKEQASLEEIISKMEETYCGPMTSEFRHLISTEERLWFAENYELYKDQDVSSEDKINIAKLMLKSQAFDNFLASKFSSVKRYGGEGAESAMPLYDELFKIAAHENVHDVIVCIAHRGRLNLLACLLDLPPVLMFRKMKGKREFPPDVEGTGDVLSHLTNSVDLKYGNSMTHVTMVPNPSHLEAVNPVGAGKARARQQSLGLGDYAPAGAAGQPGDGVLCLQIHGDGAFSGQGIIAEGFAMAGVPHFNVGGTVHVILNNQIGFTTEQERGRSSLYTSCIAKTNGLPVIRVNADYPEEVIKATRLAMAYRQKFRKDVLIDFICYRKWGHNEMDEPAFTQPLMYSTIRNRQSIPDMYSEILTQNGVCSKDDLNSVVSQWTSELSEHYSQIDSYVPKANHLEKQWKGLVQAPHTVSAWETGLPTDMLKFVGAKSVTMQEDWAVHPTVMKGHVAKRLQTLEEGKDISWATAEAMAMGSLMVQGFNVRISGQDVGRGTFSHRHAMVVDQETDAIHIPLNHMLEDQQGHLELANSILSEEAVLGFEYGVSIENPNILAIWEAQFGDFFNGAQIIIDTFVSSGDTKWLLQSGLVMLLPHGLDGAGPEHSSARIERFLQLADSKEDGVDGDNINMQICNPSTPAQYFHLLRRQMVRNYRKPLIVIAPKLFLRHPRCVSDMSEMGPKTHFLPVLTDNAVDAGAVKKVVFLSGKHYYTLETERESRGRKDIAFIRLESLCPFPALELQQELSKFSNATDFLWAQEEHRNQGAWSFIAPRFENIVGKKLRYVGREVHATPAAGVAEVHHKEAKQIVEQVFS